MDGPGSIQPYSASGDVGWLHDPGAFVGWIYEERLSFRLTAAYLMSFYLCKIVWPANLSFIYTRWNIAAPARCEKPVIAAIEGFDVSKVRYEDVQRASTFAAPAGD